MSENFSWTLEARNGKRSVFMKRPKRSVDIGAQVSVTTSGGKITAKNRVGNRQTQARSSWN